MNQSYSHNDPRKQGNQLDMDVRLTQESKAFLSESGRWSKFLAIVGFVSTVLIFILYLSYPDFNPATEGIKSPMQITQMYMAEIILPFVLIISVICFFPLWFMYRFGVKTKLAFENYDTDTFTAASENLKSLFKFVGIFTIIILAIYVIVFLSAIFIAVNDVAAL